MNPRNIMVSYSVQKHALWLHCHLLWCKGGSAVSAKEMWSRMHFCITISKKVLTKQKRRNKEGVEFQYVENIMKKYQELNFGTQLSLKIPRPNGKGKTKGGILKATSMRLHKSLCFINPGFAHHPQLRCDPLTGTVPSQKNGGFLQA